MRSIITEQHLIKVGALYLLGQLRLKACNLRANRSNYPQGSPQYLRTNRRLEDIEKDIDLLLPYTRVNI